MHIDFVYNVIEINFNYCFKLEICYNNINLSGEFMGETSLSKSHINLCYNYIFSYTLTKHKSREHSMGL